MSRLTIDMSNQQQQSAKALAAMQGKTIKQYTLERLFPGDADADQAWQELKTLLENRINDGLAGKVSANKRVGENKQRKSGTRWTLVLHASNLTTAMTNLGDLIDDQEHMSSRQK